MDPPAASDRRLCQLLGENFINFWGLGGLVYSRRLHESTWMANIPRRPFYDGNDSDDDGSDDDDDADADADAGDDDGDDDDDED